MKDYFLPNIQSIDADCPRNDTVDFLYRFFSEQLADGVNDGCTMAPVRVLAEKFHVAPQTIRKVYGKLEENGLLRCPDGRRSWQICSDRTSARCLGLVLPCSFGSYFQFQSSQGQRRFSIYSSLIEKAAEKHLAILPVHLPPPDAPEAEIRQSLLQIRKQCSGIIHLGHRGYAEDRPLEFLCREKGLPQVSLNCRLFFPNISMISFNPVKTVSLFVNYMRELGHRRFACLFSYSQAAVPSWIQYIMTSPEELRTCFAEAGVRDADLHIVNLNSGTAGSDLQVLKELLSLSDAPTAFLCRDDDLAIRFLALCRQLQLSIPEDLSIFGFNNLCCSTETSPPLSTIYNPLSELGQAVVEHLSGISPPGTGLMLDPHLIVRGSTGPCRQIPLP